MAPCTILHWRSTVLLSEGGLYRDRQQPLGADPPPKNSVHRRLYPSQGVQVSNLDAEAIQVLPSNSLNVHQCRGSQDQQATILRLPLSHCWTDLQTGKHVLTVVPPVQGVHGERPEGPRQGRTRLFHQSEQQPVGPDAEQFRKLGDGGLQQMSQLHNPGLPQFGPQAGRCQNWGVD